MSVLRLHISDSMIQLRRSVLLGSIVLWLCLVSHILSACFVHFTDVRYRADGFSALFGVGGASAGDAAKASAPAAGKVSTGSGKATNGDSSPIALSTDAPNPARMDAVVQIKSMVQASAQSLVKPEAGRAGLASESAQLQEAPAGASTKTLGPWDGWLRLATDGLGSIGLVCAWAIVLMCFLGAVVTTGSGALGMHQLVSAMMWSLVVAMLVTPWRGVLDEIPIGGVLADYHSMVRGSARAKTNVGMVEFVGTHLALPGLLAVASMMTLWRVLRGFEHATMTPVTAFDRQVEAELEDIRKGNVSLGTGRSAAALRGVMHGTGGTVASAVPALTGAGAKPFTKADARRAAKAARAANRNGSGEEGLAAAAAAAAAVQAEPEPEPEPQPEQGGHGWVSHNDRISSKPNESPSGFRRPI